MIGKVKRPSKTNQNGNRGLSVIFISVVALVVGYLLADYSVLWNKAGSGIAKGSSPSITSPVEILSSGDSLLGCEFRSNRENIIYGGKVRFSWNCALAEKCSFDGVEYGPLSNGVEVTPENTRRYILECSSGERTEIFAKSVGVFEFVIRELSSDGGSVPAVEEKLDPEAYSETSESNPL